LGYRGAYSRLQTEANLFYMNVNNEQATVVQSESPRVTTFGNIDSSVARGTELKVNYHFKAHDYLYANYTYERISDSLDDPATEETTPRDKVNFGGSTALGHGIVASANAGYKDTSRFSSTSAPAYLRVDARLAYEDGRGVTLFVAGQNLLDPNHIEYSDGLNIPRTYQAGISVVIGSKQ
jgi:outer membrane receptor protein involved in Fe transport